MESLVPVSKITAAEGEVEPRIPVSKRVATKQEVKLPIPVSGIGATYEELKPYVPTSEIVSLGVQLPIKEILGSSRLNLRLWLRRRV